METTNKIKTFLPVFKGFYGSQFDEENFEGETENFGLEDNFEFHTFVDWGKRYQELSKQFCRIIENEMSDFIVSIEYENLYSPKFYNFSNDSINCTIEPKIEAIKTYIYENKKAFEEYLAGHFKSRSGFISFYEYTFDVWVEYTKDFTDYTQKELFLGAVLDFIGTNEQMDDNTLQNGLIDFHISNFYTDEFYELPEVKKHYADDLGSVDFQSE